MICISIKKDTMQGTIDVMQKATKLDHVDIIELRIDSIADLDMKRLLRNKTKPVIVTNRPNWQDGAFKGDRKQRVDLLKKAVSLKSDYIDVEFDIAEEFANIDLGKTKLIVSRHFFDEKPLNLKEIHENLTKYNPHFVKLVTTANKLSDNFKIFELLKKTDYPTIAFCMGKLGQISRILTFKFGGKFIYAALADGQETAPGQIPIKELIDVYSVHSIDPDTKVYGILGKNADTSVSPIAHNKAFKACNITSVYVRFKVEESEDLSQYIKFFKEFNINGISVTVPHKEKVVKFVNEFDSNVQKMGVVNTIINNGINLKAFNTDLQSAINALEEKIKEVTKTCNSRNVLQGKKVAIIGAGGTGRTIAFGLADKGAEITIVNRKDSNRGQILQSDITSSFKDVKCDFLEMEKFDDLLDVELDIIVNATTLGMAPDDDKLTPIPNNEIFKKGMFIFDVVYNPSKTLFIEKAKEKGCYVIDGVEMFVGQAELQFKYFTGLDAPNGLIRNEVEDWLQKKTQGDVHNYHK